MQNPLLPGERVRIVSQVKPDQPMPFQRQAIGAQSILPGFNPSVREKLPERAFTYWTNDTFATVQYGKDFHPNAAYPLKVLARYITNKKCNDILHGPQI
jgi:hypothetical protein